MLIRALALECEAPALAENLFFSRALTGSNPGSEDGGVGKGLSSADSNDASAIFRKDFGVCNLPELFAVGLGLNTGRDGDCPGLGWPT